MMRNAIFILLMLSFLPLANTANATPIVADLSNYRIDIDARFIGTRLFLFGSQNTSGDIVVVVRGPNKKYTVRRKERVAGMWINRRYVEFQPAPEFYAIASSRELSTLTKRSIMEKLNISPNTLLDVSKLSSRKLNVEEFKTAFLESQAEKGLYNEPKALQFMDETLFKTTLEFPDTIPKGDYRAEIYLLQDNTLIAAQSIPILVSKVGLDSLITTLAHELPWLYGLISIILALSAGWTANRVFQKL